MANHSSAICAVNRCANKVQRMARRELTAQEKAAAKRLEKIWESKRAILRWTQDEVAARCGWTQGGFYQYKAGLIPLNLEALMKISNVLGVPPNEIYPELAATIAFFATPLSVQEPRPNYERAFGFKNVDTGPDLRKKAPLISWVQAGQWSEIEDNLKPGEAEDWVQTTASTGPHAYALRVRGDSMEPEFRDGDVIVVDPEQRARNGSYVVVRLEADQEATFKQFVVDGPRRYLKPLNSRYPIMEIDGEAVICGVVVEKRKVYK